ncbi:hypothetical protein FOL47_007529 [Perkinsus chesapeaki]|uniref:TFIIS central domain-containing protein n=1 Tax=Perkinsus chesapeaki TaxID=330153 RepID=A0A7J6LKU2_PERCH|nr:hypothetical protein FOL47_007529 [Perkinsus chesapeaki]
MKFSWSEPTPSTPPPSITNDKTTKKPIKVLDAPPRQRSSSPTKRRTRTSYNSKTTPRHRTPTAAAGGGTAAGQLIFKKDVKSETAALMRQLVSEKRTSPRSVSTPRKKNYENDVRNLLSKAAGRSREIEKRRGESMAAVLKGVGSGGLEESKGGGDLIISKVEKVKSPKSSNKKNIVDDNITVNKSKDDVILPVGAFSWKASVGESTGVYSSGSSSSSEDGSDGSGNHRIHRFNNKRKRRRKGQREGSSDASWSLPSSDDDDSCSDNRLRKRSKSSSSMASSSSMGDGYSSFIRVYRAKKKKGDIDKVGLKMIWQRLSESDKDIWRKEDIRQLSIKRLKSDIRSDILTPSNLTSWCNEMKMLKDPHLGNGKNVDVTLLMVLLQRLAKQAETGTGIKSVFKDRIKKDILPMLDGPGGWGGDLRKPPSATWLQPIGKSIKASLKKIINMTDDGGNEDYISSVKRIKNIMGIEATYNRSSSSSSTPKRAKDNTQQQQQQHTVSIEDQRKKVMNVLESKALIDEGEDRAKKGAQMLEDALWEEYGIKAYDKSRVSDYDLKEYYQRVRTLTFNLRQNAALRGRLLSSESGPKALAVMSVEEMATEEQQATRRDMVEKAIKAVVRQEKETLVEDRQKIMDLHQRNDSPPPPEDPPAPSIDGREINKTMYSPEPSESGKVIVDNDVKNIANDGDNDDEELV